MPYFTDQITNSKQSSKQIQLCESFFSTILQMDLLLIVDSLSHNIFILPKQSQICAKTPEFESEIIILILCFKKKKQHNEKT